MAELLFILTIVFVAYVIFVVLGHEKRKKEEVKQTAKPEGSKPVAAVKTETAVKPKPATAKPKPKPKPAKPKAAAAKKPAPAKKAPVKVASDSLKNPKTGEVSKIANNYRFTKRWIKDALVAEGLVDKIYKNDELDEATTAKIDGALEQLKAMKKYQ